MATRVWTGLGEVRDTKPGTIHTPPGTIKSLARRAGSAIKGWLLCDASAVSRTVYASLFASITWTTTGTTTNGSALINGVASLADVEDGMLIEGPGIANGTTISSHSAGTITMSANAGAGAGAGTLRFLPYGQGDGSTTFNVPDLRNGRSPVGKGIGAVGSTIFRLGRQDQGTDVQSLTIGQVPDHSHVLGGTTGTESNDHSHTQGGTFTSGTVSSDHTHVQAVEFVTIVVNRFATNQGGGATIQPYGDAGTAVNKIGSTAGGGVTSGISANHSHQTTISGSTSGVSANATHTLPANTGTSNSTGGSNPTHNNMPPVTVVNFFIKT
jgi:microcystin-dependent protein